VLADDFELETEVHDTVLHAPSGEEVWERFVVNYGPTKMLAESLDDDRREELHRNWVELFEQDRDGEEIVQSRTFLLITGIRR